MEFFFFLIIGIVLFSIFRFLNNQIYWNKGEIPSSFTKSKENLIEILMSLSLNVMKLQHEGFRDKQIYLFQYIKKFNYFQDQEDFFKNFKNSQQVPLKTKSILKWINAHYPKEANKTNIAYFVAGLCFVDGEISPRELQFLRKLTRELNISEHFDSIISSYQEKENQGKKEQSNRDQGYKRKSYDIVFKILEISPTEDFNEIKSAYRKLVKIHHPDRLIDADEVEIELAHNRFIEIQKAYEILEKRYA